MLQKLKNVVNSIFRNTLNFMEKCRLFIIGTIPPPIGGVTVHTKRLMDYLDQFGIKYIFIPLITRNLPRIFGTMLFIRERTIFHFHSSNSIVKSLLSLISKLNRNAIFINTMHGNLITKHGWNYRLHYLSLRWADYPIMLNQGSYDVIKVCNKNAKMLSAFIPPVVRESLPIDFQKQIDAFKEDHSYIFATNAYNLSYQGKEETYGGSHLMEVFNKMDASVGLIFSDPTGNYKQFLKDKFSVLPPNVLFLNGMHSFYEVMAQSDCLIRYTASDGDSLSIREALYLGKPVITTDVVSRPEGVTLLRYGDDEALINMLNFFVKTDVKQASVKVINGADQLKSLYEQIIRE